MVEGSASDGVIEWGVEEKGRMERWGDMGRFREIGRD